jgi:hypothetical protein
MQPIDLLDVVVEAYMAYLAICLFYFLSLIYFHGIFDLDAWIDDVLFSLSFGLIKRNEK